MKILICDSFDSSLSEKLAKYGEVIADKDKLAEADIALVRSKTKCTKEWIDQAPNLKLIIRGGVGLDNVDIEHAKTKNIKVQNTPEASSIAVAELAFAFMIALPCHVIKAHNGMVEGKWLKKECKRSELYQKTLGLIGMGRIAYELATRAKAFGMNVICYRNSGQSSPVAEVKSDLDTFLSECDYISLHVPLTDSTTGIINKDTISKMKPGAFIINTARGKCVVEEDLANALNEGNIAGYATDVWHQEPPGNSPLIKAKNTLFAPHIGASTSENLLRIGESINQKIADFVAG